MLTLTQISQRISELEEETFYDENDRLSTWFNMVKWQHFIYLHGDSWHDVFEKLPKDDEIKKVYSSLFWFPIWKFTDVLPATGDGWLSEKVQICLGAWLSVAFEEGYTQEALSCSEAMNDCLLFVSDALINGDWVKFHEQKTKEHETWELKLKYRRQAHEGELTPEATEWLRENDGAFLENHIKKQSEVKPIEKPVALETIENLETTVSILPQNEARQPVTNGPVTVKYLGGLRGFSLETVSGTRAIEPGDVITVPNFVWANIQSGVMPKEWWVRL